MSTSAPRKAVPAANAGTRALGPPPFPTGARLRRWQRPEARADDIGSRTEELQSQELAPSAAAFLSGAGRRAHHGPEEGTPYGTERTADRDRVKLRREPPPASAARAESVPRNR